MKNKTIPYGRQKICPEDIAAVKDALSADFITQGPKVREFEEALCRYTGARYCAALSSGTAALHLSMLALGIGKGDKVITSTISFAASANCALYAGARPLFADIDDATWHMDIEKLKDILKSPARRRAVKAVIAVHFMGAVSDMAALRKICARHGIRVVEDAAHALGAEYRDGSGWINVGSSAHSDITTFSFHPIKHITTGEGGAVLTNDRKIYESVLKLRHHGIVRKEARSWSYDIPEIGFNYRITDFQCALGISQLKRIEDIVKERRALAAVYNDGLGRMDGVTLPRERKGTRPSYHLYVIRVPPPARDRLYNCMRAAGIMTQVNYKPIHLFSYYRKAFGHSRGDFPMAERYAEECLSLPLYCGLSASDQSRVIDTIKRFFGYGRRISG